MIIPLLLCFNQRCHAFQARASPLLGTDMLRGSKVNPLFAAPPEEEKSSTESSKAMDSDEEQASMNQLDWKKIGEQSKSFWDMASPYYEESKEGRWLFAGMIALTLVNSGVSVAFVSVTFHLISNST